MTFDTASIADLFADLIVCGADKPEFGQVEKLADTYELEVGGSAAIFATQFAKLGGRPALIGMLGADLLGEFVRGRLKDLHVDVTQIGSTSREKTPLGLNLAVKDDRAMLTVLGAIAEVTPRLVPPDFSVRHWHVAGFFLLEALQSWWPGFAREQRALGRTISLDPNWAPRGNWSDLEPLLRHIDVFLPNENEALALTGARDVDGAGRALAERTPLVVIKRGAAGASAYGAAGVRHVQVPTEFTRRPVVDTTGAGDNFDAGFVWAWLRQQPLEDCLQLATRCGSASTLAAGGVRGQYQMSEATQ